MNKLIRFAAAPVIASIAATTAPATTAPAGGTSQPSTGSPDAFSDGWFSDPTAIPQAFLWGLLLTGVGVGIYVLSRKVRRYWVGILVGFIPFIVVLYFFYENVNRLLPPNL